MNRLTQQKYDLTCALMKLGFEIHSGNEHLLFAAVDAYAVARESKEIAELKADNARWCKDFYKIKFELETADAEIKRLRDVIRELWNRDAISLEEMREILSPAPVTEGPKKTFSLQMYGCNRCEWYGQVGESIETESYDVCPKCLSEDLTLLDSPKNEDQE